jgi:hypothetical protein
MMRQFVQAGLALMVTATTLLAAAPAAHADAAGPTDYRTDIVSIEPAGAPILIEMIGGDAFLSLEQLEPVEVVVLGYQGEPYLRFDPDGTVYENRRSPAVWLNQERYGNEEPPSFASADARPEWFEVATNGRYAWHDHRSHWMNSQPPPSAEAGDQVLEATVPVRINGETVTITVASYLLHAPSVVPSLIGALVGLAAAAIAWRSNRASQAVIGLLVAGSAALLGSVAFLSVPAETQPSPLLWLLPVLAFMAALVLVLVRNRTATTVYLDGLAVTAGGTRVGWGVVRFDALRRALIPTDAPAVVDRLVISLVLVVGAVLLAQGLHGLIRPQRLIPS